jgi:serine/threonine-protein kinase
LAENQLEHQSDVAPESTMSTASNPGPKAAGRRIGRYELGESIAKGGMAEVYRAQLTGPGEFRRAVAVKRMLPSLGKDPEFVRLFEREARLAARLHHANVVQVLDYGQDEAGAPYLILELVPGHDLRRVTERAASLGLTVPLPLTAFIAGEVLRGLAHAHDLRADDGRPAGLIHRDVSPHNVLISFAGEVKLSDFGIAKALDATLKARRSAVRGKVGYMAPEQALGQDVDGRADLFSVGVLLYELSTRTRLWGAGASERETYARLIAGQFERPRTRNPQIPEALDTLVVRLLATDRDARPRSAEEALRELGATGLVAPTASLDLAAFLRVLDGVPTSLEGKGSTRSLPAAGAASLPATRTMDAGDTMGFGAADRAVVETPGHRRVARIAIKVAALGTLVGASLTLAVMALRAPSPGANAGLVTASSAPNASASLPAVSLEVNVAPSDALLTVEGVPLSAGQGHYTLAATIGQTITLHASRDGYTAIDEDVVPQAGGPAIDLTLQPTLQPAPASTVVTPVATIGPVSPRVPALASSAPLPPPAAVAAASPRPLPSPAPPSPTPSSPPPTPATVTQVASPTASASPAPSVAPSPPAPTSPSPPSQSPSQSQSLTRRSQDSVNGLAPPPEAHR